MSDLYPSSPVLENYDFLTPSAHFKRAARKVIWSIVLFVLFYIVLVLFALAVMGASIFAGIEVLAFPLGFWSLVIAACIMLIGIMFFAFTIKFIFSRTKEEPMIRIEVMEQDYPELFEFIRKTAGDTKSPMPRRVFITPEVNAGVFYTSSFWSMFFPTGKNLVLGMSLMHCTTLSEFKSVLGHEFGHFSQRSMMLGSYIYTVNKALFNLVYNRDRFDTWVFEWASSGGVTGFFGMIINWMIERIRDLLKIAYNLINLSYLKLSREMEYHADLVAVSVAGSDIYANSLNKIAFSNFSYEYLMAMLGKWTQNGTRSNNVFVLFEPVSRHLKEMNDFSGEDAFYVSPNELNRVTAPPRLIIKDQWSSHPTTEDRLEKIQLHQIAGIDDKRPAAVLIGNRQLLEEKLTNLLYGEQEKKLETALNEDFMTFMRQEIEKTRISERYKGYYDDRVISQFDTDVILDSPCSFDDLYAQKNIEMIRNANRDTADIETLKLIVNKTLQTRFFEFEGVKYKRKQAAEILSKVKSDQTENSKEIILLDHQCYSYFFRLHDNEEKRIGFKEKFKLLMTAGRAVSDIREISVQISKLLDKIASEVQFNERGIRELATSLRIIENKLKEQLKSDVALLSSDVLDEKRISELSEYGMGIRYFGQAGSIDDQRLNSTIEVLNDLNNGYESRYNELLMAITTEQLALEDSKAAKPV